MTDPSIPTLIDRKGMGGVIALDGFDYQAWAAAARVPGWLADPAFEAVGLEMHEDFEASFFVPNAPAGATHRLERFQAKSATLARSELIAVFEAFVVFSERHPDTVRIHTLVTPALPANLGWVVRDGIRVANARPFYLNYAAIMDDSEVARAQKLLEEFGARVGSHLARDIAIELAPHDDGYWHSMFSDGLEVLLGLDWGRSMARRAFGNVCRLLHEKRGSKVGRDALYAAIADGNRPIGADKSLDLDFVRGRSDAKPGHLGLDAEDGGQQAGSGAVAYASSLQKALERTASWARGQGYRRVRVDAPLRLSAAFGLGVAFRAASGFDLDYGTPSGSWQTDDHPQGSNAGEWSISVPETLGSSRLTVVVGVIRDPVEDVRRHLDAESGILRLHLPRAVVSAEDVQTCVRTIKDAVSAVAARLRPDGIDLFFLGPGALAAALGHRWNALPPTVFFEHDRAGGYTPTVVVR